MTLPHTRIMLVAGVIGLFVGSYTAVAQSFLGAEIERALTGVYVRMVELPDGNNAAAVARFAEELHAVRRERTSSANKLQELQSAYVKLAISNLIETAALEGRLEHVLNEARSLKSRNDALRGQLADLAPEPTEPAGEANPARLRDVERAAQDELAPHLGESPPTPDVRRSSSSPKPIPVGDHAVDDWRQLMNPGRGSPSLTRTSLEIATRRIADALASTRGDAMRSKQERTFEVDVEKRLFLPGGNAPVRLDAALALSLQTVQSEVASGSRGRIRFYPDGSSTGGRIRLALEGHQANVTVDWSSGNATIELDPAAPRARRF